VYITYLAADAFITLVISVSAAGLLIYGGVEPVTAYACGMAIGLSAHACRVSGEAIQVCEEVVYALQNGIRIFREKDDDRDTQEEPN
jgi:hypothetical protein